MVKNQKGFGWILWIAMLLIVSAVALTCWQLYQKAILDQNLKVAKAKAIKVEKYKPLTVVAVGDITCDPKTKATSTTAAKKTSTTASKTTTTTPAAANTATCQDAAVAAQVAKIKPDALITLGDQQYDDGGLDKFQTGFAKNWAQFNKILYPTPGNHEYVTNGASGYYTYFKSLPTDISKGYYSFSLGNWNIISLNSNCDKIGGCDTNSTQVKWLKEQLKNNTSRCTLAFWHHPRFTSGKYFNDADSKSRSLSFWESLEDAKADVVLNGHDHLYQRFGLQNAAGKKDAQGIREFIVGTGGKELYKQSGSEANSQQVVDYQYGVLKLQLFKNAYKWEFVAVNGDILDDGQQNCN